MSRPRTEHDLALLREAGERNMSAGLRASGKPRTNGRKPTRTPEQKAAASAARVKALRERRKAAGLRVDGTAPAPKPTKEEKRAMMVRQQQRHMEAEKRALAVERQQRYRAGCLCWNHPTHR